MDLTADLNKLGASSKAIARSLELQGIRGERQELDCCPIAVYLHKLHPDHRFEVDRSRVQIDGEGRCVLPAAVAWFVRDFDYGEYPALETALPAEQRSEGGGS